jgi:neutral ceramidase
MRDGEPVDAGERPGSANTRSWLAKPRHDVGEFGAVLVPPSTSYVPGAVVRVAFASANPNNDLRRGSTYLEVQQSREDAWVRVADDGDWSTTFEWRRDRGGHSVATVTWTIPDDASGEYRIVHFGAARAVDGLVTQFTGCSPEFRVVSGQ